MQRWKGWWGCALAPRISDAREWISEIPTVPLYYLAKPQPRERDWDHQWGKKTVLSLALVRLCENDLGGVAQVGASAILTYHYS